MPKCRLIQPQCQMASRIIQQFVASRPQLRFGQQLNVIIGKSNPVSPFIRIIIITGDAVFDNSDHSTHSPSASLRVFVINTSLLVKSVRRQTRRCDRLPWLFRPSGRVKIFDNRQTSARLLDDLPGAIVVLRRCHKVPVFTHGDHQRGAASMNGIAPVGVVVLLEPYYPDLIARIQGLADHFA